MTVGSGLYLNQSECDQLKVNTVVRQLIEGRSNAVGTFTLGASVAATTVNSITCAPSSVVRWQPTTANAAAQMATLYLPSTDVAAGGFTLHHASNATTDQTFNFAITG